MAIVTDQSFNNNFDPGNPPALPADVLVITLTLNDADDNGIIDANGDIVNGSPVSAVYNGDVITMNGVDIVGATIYTQDGGRYFTPTDDSVLVDGTITNVTFVPDSTQLTLPDLGPSCLTEGTLVETDRGEIAVEDIQVGDKLRTKDHGFQPVNWIGHRTVAARDEFAPICFKAGSIGNSRDLYVSPEHRMLVSGWKCELLFGQEEMLCAAKHLTGSSDDIFVAPREEVTYFHVMFEQHEIIYTDGAETESFFLGGEVAKADRSTFLELVKLFPNHMCEKGAPIMQAARPFLKQYEAQTLNAL